MAAFLGRRGHVTLAEAKRAEHPQVSCSTTERTDFDLDTPLGKAAFEGKGVAWPNVLARIAPALATSADEQTPSSP